MITRIILFLSAISAIQLSGCARKTAGAATQTESQTFPKEWTGTYSGTIPCADCPGIKTEIVLNGDYSFTSTSLYLDRDVVPRKESGTFNWNQKTNSVKLQLNNGQTELFHISGNSLTMLDRNGNKITGIPEDNYVLHKTGNQTTGLLTEQIISKRWLLKELQNVPRKKLQNRESPYIQFDPEKSRIYGFAGCNNFFGTYELDADSSIHLSGIGTTKKLCIETMEIENAFLNVLDKCKFISISGSTLTLEDQDRNQLARFETD